MKRAALFSTILLAAAAPLGAAQAQLLSYSCTSKFVRHLSQRVILIDGDRLADLMIEHNVGVRVARAIEFKRIDEDYFSDEE